MNWQSVPTVITGLIIGLLIAAPVGAVGVWCLRRTLVGERSTGLAICLGMATAGALYASMGGFQLILITNNFDLWLVWLRGIGGLIFCYMGIRVFLVKSASRAILTNKAGSTGVFILALGLSLASPLTVISFTAIYPGFGLDKVIAGNPAAIELIIGVVIGSVLWGLILMAIMKRRSINLSLTALKWVNRVAGVIIVAWGLVSLGSLITRM